MEVQGALNRFRLWFQGATRWQRAGVVSVLAVLLALLVLYGAYRSALRGLPKLDTATDYQPFLPTVIYDVKGRVVAEYGEQRRIVVPYSLIPKRVVQAFLAAEDASFFSHGGVNIFAIARAALKNFTSGRVRQGASTITQQVAKTFFLSSERTILRKLREVALSYKLEQAMSKEEILFLYLNQIYFGEGAYGVESASNIYFGKSITEITVAEAAILAGLPKAPSAYSPYDNPVRARQRQMYVIDQMVDNKFISVGEAEAARAEVVAIRRWQNPSFRTGSYSEHVRRQLVDTYGEDRMLHDGLRVESGMDLDMQLAAQAAVQKGILELEQRHGYHGAITRVPESKREEFLKQLEKEVHRPEPGGVIRYLGGEQPETPVDDPTPPAKPMEALVTKVEMDRATLAIGNHTAVLPQFEAAWAVRFNINAFAYNSLKDLRKAFKPGDVILVSLVNRANLGKSEDDKKRLEKWTKGKFPAGAWWASLLPVPQVQSALLAADPKTAEIRAMVGGYDYQSSQFNRTVQAKRQPGSSFKPIVYAAAMEFGYNPATMVVDAPDVYENMATDSTEVTYWKPKNFDDTFYGPITLREALIRSRNVPTLRIAQDVGIEAVLNMAKKLGITTTLERNFSIALGSNGVSLFELATAYTAIVADGVRRDLKTVRRVLDRDGKVLEQHVPHWVVENRQPSETERIEGDTDYYHAERALDSQKDYLLVYLLKSVVANGTGWRARELGRIAGGKTGTTNDNVDSWFTGFTPELMAGVWVGYDQANMNLGPAETGSMAANPIWNDFMRKALQGVPVADFPVPEKIVFREIDAKTGQLAGPASEKIVSMPFIYGTEPSATTAVEVKPNEEDLQKMNMGF